MKARSCIALCAFVLATITTAGCPENVKFCPNQAPETGTSCDEENLRCVYAVPEAKPIDCSCKKDSDGKLEFNCSGDAPVEDSAGTPDLQQSDGGSDNS